MRKPEFYDFFSKPEWTNTISLVGLMFILTLIRLKLSPRGGARTETNPAICNTVGLAVIKSTLFASKVE